MDALIGMEVSAPGAANTPTSSLKMSMMDLLSTAFSTADEEEEGATPIPGTPVSSPPTKGVVGSSILGASGLQSSPPLATLTSSMDTTSCCTTVMAKDEEKEEEEEEKTHEEKKEFAGTSAAHTSMVADNASIATQAAIISDSPQRTASIISTNSSNAITQSSNPNTIPNAPPTSSSATTTINTVDITIINTNHSDNTHNSADATTPVQSEQKQKSHAKIFTANAAANTNSITNSIASHNVVATEPTTPMGHQQRGGCRPTPAVASLLASARKKCAAGATSPHTQHYAAVTESVRRRGPAPRTFRDKVNMFKTAENDSMALPPTPSVPFRHIRTFLMQPSPIAKAGSLVRRRSPSHHRSSRKTKSLSSTNVLAYTPLRHGGNATTSREGAPSHSAGICLCDPPCGGSGQQDKVSLSPPTEIDLDTILSPKPFASPIPASLLLTPAAGAGTSPGIDESQLDDVHTRSLAAMDSIMGVLRTGERPAAISRLPRESINNKSEVSNLRRTAASLKVRNTALKQQLEVSVRSRELETRMLKKELELSSMKRRSDAVASCIHDLSINGITEEANETVASIDATLTCINSSEIAIADALEAEASAKAATEAAEALEKALESREAEVAALRAEVDRLSREAATVISPLRVSMHSVATSPMLSTLSPLPTQTTTSRVGTPAESRTRYAQREHDLQAVVASLRARAEQSDFEVAFLRDENATLAATLAEEQSLNATMARELAMKKEEATALAAALPLADTVTPKTSTLRAPPKKRTKGHNKGRWSRIKRALGRTLHLHGRYSAHSTSHSTALRLGPSLDISAISTAC